MTSLLILYDFIFDIEWCQNLCSVTLYYFFLYLLIFSAYCLIEPRFLKVLSDSKGKDLEAHRASEPPAGRRRVAASTYNQGELLMPGPL